MKMEGKIVDIISEKIFEGYILIKNGRISEVVKAPTQNSQYIMPGFIDSHVHIESSMLTPAQFAKLAVKHGTIGVVTDPHEMANVMGIEGVEFMIENSKTVPMKFFFGVPSCVPATDFESSGHKITSADIEELMKRDDLYFLSEMMNFPGVIFDDNEVLRKMKAAKLNNKPIDGHAPGLRGKQLRKYVSAGISTDHECLNIDEALEKIKEGMKIQIREGSAAKNLEALFPIIDQFPESVMLCTDDCHPDDLINGHMNLHVKHCIEKGIDIFKILKIAILNPVKHYSLPVGMLQPDDPADFIIVDNLSDFNIKKVVIDGEIIFNNKQVLFEIHEISPLNNFERCRMQKSDIGVTAKSEKINVIEAIDGELITNKIVCNAKIEDGEIVSDVENDNLKIVVINRYNNEAKPVVGFIRNFKLKKGAIAGSIAHDSHNIIAIGTNDDDLILAINKIIDNKGGIVVVDNSEINDLKLEIAGLLTNHDGAKVASDYKAISDKARALGSDLHAPFMTLSFMALLVIPSFKIGDKGLFDGNKFELDILYA
jgi:adenine deaminase